MQAELVRLGRNADTLNHYRRIVRGIFGTHPVSPALGWQWAAAKPESEGQLHFYTPPQLAALKRHAHAPLDVAIYTKGRRVRSVPMSGNVRAALWP